MLIDRTDIAAYRELARGVKEDKINPFIQDAERLDLKPLLGSALYFDLVKNKTADKYVDLLEPFDFTVNEITYAHVGIKKILSIFSSGRYTLFGSFSDTSFGFVEKNYYDGKPVPFTSKKDVYKYDQQVATQYFAEIALFLDNNKDTYPLWKKGCEKRPMGTFRISKIV